MTKSRAEETRRLEKPKKGRELRSGDDGRTRDEEWRSGGEESRRYKIRRGGGRQADAGDPSGERHIDT